MIACMTIFNFKAVYSQKEKGQIVVSGGVGYSIAKAAFVLDLLDAESLSSSYSYPYTYTKISGIPAINGMVDYGIASKFSIGLVCSYQSWSADYNSYTSYNSTTGQLTTYPASKTTGSRLNYGLRALFHFGGNPNLDMYTGLRIGQSVWTEKTTNLNPKYELNSRSSIAPQTLFGIKYFFTDLLGAGAEFAIGAPYYSAVGVSYRLGNSSPAKGKGRFN